MPESRDSNHADGRTISVCDTLEPYIDGEDIWATLPVRVAHTPLAGLVLEIGRYSFDADDISRLSAAIVDWHLADLGGLRRGK